MVERRLIEFATRKQSSARVNQPTVHVESKFDSLRRNGRTWTVREYERTISCRRELPGDFAPERNCVLLALFTEASTKHHQVSPRAASLPPPPESNTHNNDI